jgi:hypothetical protein
MPLIVLLVFYALHRVQHPRAVGTLPSVAPAATESSPQQ